MFKFVKNVCSLLLLEIILVTVKGQGAPPKCSDAANYPIQNITVIKGTWYNVARSPASQFDCVESEVHLMNNNTDVHIILRRSQHDSFQANENLEAHVNANEINDERGFGISFNNKTNIMYKILSFTNDYSILCGFTNATDDSTAFGLILSRERLVDNGRIEEWKNQANRLSNNFANTTLVKQSDKCFKNSASSLAPFTVTMMMIFCAIMEKF